jgi:hypothetical protein
MSSLGIFVFGFIVTGITLTAVLLIGLSEAADPVHSRLSDLSPLERKLVERPDEGEVDASSGAR